jgi:hypothetical protein
MCMRKLRVIYGQSLSALVITLTYIRAGVGDINLPGPIRGAVWNLDL